MHLLIINIGVLSLHKWRTISTRFLIIFKFVFKNFLIFFQFSMLFFQRKQIFTLEDFFLFVKIFKNLRKELKAIFSYVQKKKSILQTFHVFYGVNSFGVPPSQRLQTITSNTFSFFHCLISISFHPSEMSFNMHMIDYQKTVNKYSMVIFRSEMFPYYFSHHFYGHIDFTRGRRATQAVMIYSVLIIDKIPFTDKHSKQ